MAGAAPLPLLPFAGGGPPPFAACVRLTPELRSALLAHAATPGGASVTFHAAGGASVRHCAAAVARAIAACSVALTHACAAALPQHITVGGRAYPCASYPEAEGTCSLYAARAGGAGLELAADVQRCVRCASAGF